MLLKSLSEEQRLAEILAVILRKTEENADIFNTAITCNQT